MDETKEPKKKTTGCWVFLWIVLALVLLFILIGSCGGSGDTQPQGSEDVAAEASAVESPENTKAAETSEESESPVPVSLEECVSLIEAIVQKNFDNNCEISIEGSVVSINVWSEGVTSGAGLALAGNAEAVEAWNGLVESMETMCGSAQELLNAGGHDDMVAFVQVVSDIDKTKALLCVLDDFVMYDPVNGINLMGE